MWYTNYLQAFERPYAEVPDPIKQEIADKMKRFKSEQPLCSVVAIAHNEEKHLAGCLWSLCNNVCDFPVEIVVVNNHSTDATEQILDELGVIHYYEERKSPGFARLCGLNHAKGMYHVCIDADTLYPPHYVATHVAYLQKPNIVCTYGLWSFLPDKNHSRTGLLFYEALRDCYFRIQNINRPELCVRGMVESFHTELGRKVGYRTNIIRGEDGMMALGLKQYGKLKFLTTRKARAVTSNGTLDGRGGLVHNFWFRVKKGIRNIRLLFTTQSEYKDQDYNLIKKEKQQSE
jgi:cellulose synthase/poly-beta-1,6-N-acetylglucosamine synthase-like glycosyltransferase